MSNPLKRPRRSKVACRLCRDRKKKCDGRRPCETCSDFEYECFYDIGGRKKRNKNPLLPGQERSQPHEDQGNLFHNTTSPCDRSLGPCLEVLQPQSLELNSGAAFVRGLGLKIDPDNAPEPKVFAWNIGARQLPGNFVSLSILNIVSHGEMTSLAKVYLDKVDPCYGYIDRATFFANLDLRWSRESTLEPYDAVLCGVAAMGYLFSRRKAIAAELPLVESARSTLEQCSMSGIPSLSIITGWALRLAYLRLISSPHTAWMASCSLLHLVEASGLHLESPSRSLLIRRPQNVDPDIRRRFVGFAQYINTWISFDLGRSRVVLRGASYTSPTCREGDYTAEMLNLLPLSETLEPNNSLDSAQLIAMLSNVLDSSHTEPPFVLSQCNLMLCVFRRLRALHYDVCKSDMDRILNLITRSLICAKDLAYQNCPWSHVANVPFQIVSTLLAIDSAESLSRLDEAIQTIKIIAEIYDTAVMREAFRTAGLLILLQQKRKTNDAQTLSSILDGYFDASLQFCQENPNDGSNIAREAESVDLDDLLAEMPNLNNFDCEQFFVSENPVDFFEMAF
ncbi:uncharacterized protein N7484_012031 [Penicillium longicatenatum]|uniref:uncharacterized protein n=1 Tax=Penicillium longicatenatum TaxID=1561947 RepID=UPI00254977C7|nr:uncharacterized protein N7484_012031 [Penicillium longicatenatum]KAJ5631931.1 hypothetical protein N7484_012031 [Penicillium longicatenatum]